MKFAIVLASLMLIVVLSAAPIEDRAKPVSVIELIAFPDKFDGKTVAVTGYLTLGERAELYLHEEDARNLLPNSLSVDTTSQMRRDHEKLDREYVTLKGKFIKAKGGDPGAYERGHITDVQSCTFWSDPRHPISLRLENMYQKK